MELWRMNNPMKAFFAQIRDRARRRGTPFTISYQYFIETTRETGYDVLRGRNTQCLHLDRVDCLKGYEPGNIRVISALDNLRKAAEDKLRKQNFVRLKQGLTPLTELDETDALDEPDPF